MVTLDRIKRIDVQPDFEVWKEYASGSGSNLDEFYMVRVASLKDQVHVGYKKTDIAGMTAKEQLKAISQQTHDLVHVQYSTLNRSLVPALEKAGLHVIFEHEAFSEKQKEFVDRYFEDNVYPVLTPMAMDSSRPFPLNDLLQKRYGCMTFFFGRDDHCT